MTTHNSVLDDIQGDDGLPILLWSGRKNLPIFRAVVHFCRLRDLSGVSDSLRTHDKGWWKTCWALLSHPPDKIWLGFSRSVCYKTWAVEMFPSKSGTCWKTSNSWGIIRSSSPWNHPEVSGLLYPFWTNKRLVMFNAWNNAFCGVIILVHAHLDSKNVWRYLLVIYMPPFMVDFPYEKKESFCCHVWLPEGKLV